MAIGAERLMAPLTVTFAVLVVLPMVSPDTVLAIVKLEIGTVTAEAKLVPDGSIVAVPVVVKLLVKPDVSPSNVMELTDHRMLEVLLVMSVPVRLPNRAPYDVTYIPAVPLPLPLTVMSPEVARISVF